MKYLAYFRPNRELSNLVLKKDHVVLSSSGLHSTLCVFYMDSEKEGRLLTDLSRVSFNPFEVETLRFENFDKDSLVLKLSCPSELLELHKKIVAIARAHAEQGFEEVARIFFEDNYNPHITISKSSSDFDRNSRELIGKKIFIAEYILAKKVDSNYKQVKAFHARR